MIHDINRLPTLHIGHEKDSLTNTICIDVQPWLQDTPTLNTWEIVVNNPNGDVYVAEKVTMENGMLEWVVTASDTQYPGKGSYEVVATGPNGESISTGPVALRVDKRTEGTVSPDAPSAEAGWVNNVINAAARAEDAAERAESAAEGNAEVLAEKIAPVIGANGNWWTWDFESDAYVDTGKPTRGEKGDKGDAAEGSVKSVNGVQPDENGNVQVEMPETVTDEHIREVVKPDIDGAVAAEASKRLYVEIVPVGKYTYTSNVTVAELLEAVKNKVDIYGYFYQSDSLGPWRLHYTNYGEQEGDDINTFVTLSAYSTAGRSSPGDYAEIRIFPNGNVGVIYKTVHSSSLPNPEALVINANGQKVYYDGSTEVDIDIPEPTKSLSWNAITDKPFGEEGVVLDTTVTVEEDAAAVPIPGVVKLEDGKTYTVTWNGVEYSCVAVFAEMDGLPLVWVGDIGVMNGEEPSGIPFLIGAVPEEYVSMVGFGAAVMVLDGSMQVTMKIEAADGTIKTLDAKYLPEGYGSAQVTPKKYGAVGDGSTDDTAAFQQALAENREVYVPGGTYKLSGPLTVRGNCGLTLAQDVVLDFTQYSGDCISMQMSASIKGNHATVRVPYGFSGHVIHVASLLDANVLAIPPFTKWDPSWKTGRYLTDLNIVKPDSRGFHYSLNGDCSGVAVYISADNDASNDTDSTFIWGLNFSGVRIAGAFTHGILCENFREAWNHEMRIEAFIDACETGVELRDCNNAYISAAIQPRRAYSLSEVYKAYAKNGIVLRRSRNTDLSGSRVWDWNATYTLWQTDVQYEHIAMYGNCSGTILNDFFYYEMPSYDIRDLIYTDTAANLEKINILQEPFTRWFKPANGVPYFNDGVNEKRLALKEEVDELVPVERTLGFTEQLSKATDEDGNIFNGIGYKHGMRWNAADGKTVIEESYFTATGYIPIKPGQTLRVEGMSMETGDNTCGIILFDSNKNYLVNVQKQNIIGGASYYVGYEKTAKGFNIPIKQPSTVAYIKLSVWKQNVYEPLIAVDEEIKYDLDGYLADGIKVKAESVTGLEELIREIVGK